MLREILVSFLPYVFVIGFTPGPNNILALNAITNNGWKKGKFLIIGIGVGFLCVMTICAWACLELGKFLPMMTSVLKYVGAVYIFWLAIHVARSKPGDENVVSKESFWTGFILQFVNVKIILSGITIYTGYVLPISQLKTDLIAATLCIVAIGIMGTMTWALVGGILQNYITKYYRGFNMVMALVLIWSAWKLILV